MGRKVLHGLGVLWGTLTLVFMLFARPRPCTSAGGANESEEIVAAIRTKLGLDRPLHVRYADFLTGFVPVTVDDAGWLGRVGWANRTSQTDRLWMRLRMRLREVLSLTPWALRWPWAVRWIWSRDDSGQRLGSVGAGICRAGDEAPSFVMAIVVSWLFGSVWHHWTGCP